MTATRRWFSWSLLWMNAGLPARRTSPILDLMNSRIPPSPSMTLRTAPTPPERRCTRRPSCTICTELRTGHAAPRETSTSALYSTAATPPQPPCTTRAMSVPVTWLGSHTTQGALPYPPMTECIEGAATVADDDSEDDDAEDVDGTSGAAPCIGFGLGARRLVLGVVASAVVATIFDSCSSLL